MVLAFLSRQGSEGPGNVGTGSSRGVYPVVATLGRKNNFGHQQLASSGGTQHGPLRGHQDTGSCAMLVSNVSTVPKHCAVQRSPQWDQQQPKCSEILAVQPSPTGHMQFRHFDATNVMFGNIRCC